jgi:hypothetical protein
MSRNDKIYGKVRCRGILLLILTGIFTAQLLFAQVPADSGGCYATLGNNDPNAGSLITIDLNSGAGTLIGSTGIMGDLGVPGVPALAIKSSGEIYVTDIGNQ